MYFPLYTTHAEEHPLQHFMTGSPLAQRGATPDGIASILSTNTLATSLYCANTSAFHDRQAARPARLHPGWQCLNLVNQHSRRCSPRHPNRLKTVGAHSAQTKSERF